MALALGESPISILNKVDELEKEQNGVQGRGETGSFTFFQRGDKISFRIVPYESYEFRSL
jgi:hypothetical protein